MLARLLFLVAALLLAPAATRAQEGPAVKAPAVDPLAASWQELLQSDEARATRAALQFAAKPAEAVAFLQSKLVPIKADPKRVAKLIAELSDRDFQVRDQAQRELEYFSRFIKTDLEQAMKTSTEEEAKSRLGRLLGRIEAEEKESKLKDEKPPAQLGGPGGNVSIRTVNGVTTIFINGQQVDLTPKVITKLGPLPSWVRASRAVAILEHIGTPEALKILESVALGEAEAVPTKQAQDAVVRLKQKK